MCDLGVLPVATGSLAAQSRAAAGPRSRPGVAHGSLRLRAAAPNAARRLPRIRALQHWHGRRVLDRLLRPGGAHDGLR
eukprot:CAMPEP_0198581142 /NCGR_PEP_ID=MMETSP1462-20131121/123833_1 /TAXON_ID=1333877 /ORGANISM="Brandtodinium nutriculum, Strain RCC3387" /LENGTH=77 /DNA_ID=CAMNT_0044312513 /DNA_START=114 /DNA_END=344 /DNA_ORIENTATION=-